MQEPVIDEHDMRRIDEEWEQLTGRFGGEPEFEGAEWDWQLSPTRGWEFKCHCWLDKEQCRTLLWRIDDSLRRSLDKPYFVKKYLEKFFSIRHHLTGVASYGESADGDLLEFLRARFAQLQVPFEAMVRQSGQRYSFPNYNFCKSYHFVI